MGHLFLPFRLEHHVDVLPVVLALPILVLMIELVFTAIIFLPALWLIKQKWTQSIVGHTGRFLKISPADLAVKLDRWVRVSMYVGMAFTVLAAILPLVLLPLISVESLSPCGQAAVVLLRADAVGEADAEKPLSRIVLGSIGKMLLVGNAADKTYGMIPMEDVREIGLDEVSLRSDQSRLGCAIVQ